MTPTMKELNEFVARENRWSAIFGSRPLALDDAGDRQKIADRIDSALSPENLYCDGEISAAEARAKQRYLERVARQLQRLDPAVKFYELA